MKVDDHFGYDVEIRSIDKTTEDDEEISCASY